MPETIGYARTSTTDQVAGLQAQIRDLTAAGCGRVFSEQISSVADTREQLALALAALEPGDAFMVTKPDRLARSTVELLTIEANLTKRGVGLVVLSMGLDTRNGTNPTGKLMLTILAGVATWEREIMKERQAEGILRAQREGKYKGRISTTTQKADSVCQLTAQGMLQPQIAEACGMSIRSVGRIIKRKKSMRNGQIPPISSRIEHVSAV